MRGLAQKPEETTLYIGMITDSLGHLGLDDLLATSVSLGLQRLEFACGNWSRAPHIQLDSLLENADLRRGFQAKVADHGLAISALNCSGNPLHPGDHGNRHRDITSKTIRLAGLMGIERVVLMSGCPGGAPGDSTANWITTCWPAEMPEMLRYQWDDVLIPYWRGLVAEAEAAGVRRLCLELHGHQNVYNVETMLRLRDAVGPVVGANFDPSHLMWMGADPLAAIRGLGDAIYHVHAKDTHIDAANAALNSRIDTKPSSDLARRSWSYVTLGYGNGAEWWRRFCAELALAGYDDVLSIEHEDPLMPALDGVAKSVSLLREVMVHRA